MDVWQCHLSLAVATVYGGGISSLALINEIHQALRFLISSLWDMILLIQSEKIIFQGVARGQRGAGRCIAKNRKIH
ncbi:MAG: hypothetical protein OSB30_06575 [Candidatus Poseidoniaceae archaeon]|nr:hypothetical protein [Candidatus Poseidoniaceae archaeon]